MTNTTGPGRKLNIVWHSVAPWISSGYGQQTATFVPRIRDLGHDISISAFAGLEGHIGNWNGVPVFPQDHTRFNKYALRKYVQKVSEDGSGDDVLVIALQDVWTWADASPISGGMIADYRGLNLAAWCPVEHDPIPPNTANALEQFAARPIAMSRFGEERMRDVGLDPLYVPHGVDTNALKPNPEAAKAARAALGVAEDAFLIGMVSHNQGMSPCRKSFPEVFTAFSMFLSDHPDAVLYLHTDVLGLNQGINLTALWRRHQIPDNNIRFVNQDKYWLGEINTQQMGYMYAALDVLACPSYGEGFGIPIIEAQACGTPVIATDWTSMPELIGPGWLVDGDPWYNPGSASWWKRPSISEILGAFESAYAARGEERRAAECVEFASAYDADRVLNEYWVPVLDALSRQREVPPLLPALNREQRRAKIKAAGKLAA
jgi:glycosyltransferase involved in cell wall biosynthesis